MKLHLLRIDCLKSEADKPTRYYVSLMDSEPFWKKALKTGESATIDATVEVPGELIFISVGVENGTRARLMLMSLSSLNPGQDTEDINSYGSHLKVHYNIIVPRPWWAFWR